MVNDLHVSVGCCEMERCEPSVGDARVRFVEIRRCNLSHPNIIKSPAASRKGTDMTGLGKA
eukprot:1612886-Rhodomonas_salina.1